MTSLRASTRRLKERLFVSLTTNEKSTDTSSMEKSSTNALAESICYLNPQSTERTNNELGTNESDARGPISTYVSGGTVPEPQRLVWSVSDEANTATKALAAGTIFNPISPYRKPTPVAIYPSYGSFKYDPKTLPNKVDGIVKHLLARRKTEDFDCIALSGSSGTWLGGMLVCALESTGINVLLVRKLSENSHGPLVEGLSNVKYDKCIFVDDFTASGATYRRVTRDLAEYGVTVIGKLEHSGIE